MIFEAIILGIVIGKLRGGQLKRLGYQTLQFPFVLLLSFIILLGASILISLGHQWAIAYRVYLYIASYCLLFFVLFLNLHVKAVWLILLGAILNFAAIALNNGSMPIDLVLLEKMGFTNLLSSITTGALPNYIPIADAYSFTQQLGKKFATPPIYPIRQIFSAGDAFVALGVLLYIQKVMQSKMYRRTSSVLHFDHKGRMGRSR